MVGQKFVFKTFPGHFAYAFRRVVLVLSHTVCRTAFRDMSADLFRFAALFAYVFVFVRRIFRPIGRPPTVNRVASAKNTFRHVRTFYSDPPVAITRREQQSGAWFSGGRTVDGRGPRRINAGKASVAIPRGVVHVFVPSDGYAFGRAEKNARSVRCPGKRSSVDASRDVNRNARADRAVASRRRDFRRPGTRDEPTDSVSVHVCPLRRRVVCAKNVSPTTTGTKRSGSRPGGRRKSIRKKCRAFRSGAGNNRRKRRPEERPERFRYSLRGTS